MKKTMFITSVIMVVVMAIALTTSSLAWFTAQGVNTVTTTALTITAQVNASSGIKISTVSASEAWDTSATLGAESGYAVSGLKPYMPLAGEATPTAALLLAALDGASFIGNTINQDGQFDGTAYTATSGLFYDTLWITNTASGAGAKAVTIAPSITFEKDDETYTPSALDPVLVVAVLAENASGDYEIVQITDSKGRTGVKVGKTAAAFADGQTVNSAYTELTIANCLAASGSTSDSLPVAEDDAAFGTPKQFKVLAWYDADTLNNNNSGFDIDFVITFTATNVA